MPMSAKSAKRPKQLKITYTAKAPSAVIDTGLRFLEAYGKK